MKFSIIVPMYNVEKFAKKCIDSILSQSFKDYELIIVNDGSNDATSSIIDGYLAHNKITVINKKNGGLVSARKAGASKATGDYVVIVDGDDWIDSDYLEYLNLVVRKHKPDIILLNYIENEEKTVFPYYGNLEYGYNNYNQISKLVKEDIFNVFPSLWTKVMRRDIYIECQNKISDKVAMGEDSAVVLPLITKCKTIFYSPKAFYHYRYNPESMTNSKKKMIDSSSVVERLSAIEKGIHLSEKQRKKFSAYVAHISMNAVISYFKNFDYSTSKKKSDDLLNHKLIRKHFMILPSTRSFKELLAWCLLKYRMFWLIRLISICL